MSQWDPKSYMAEVLASSEEPKEEVRNTSFYAYTLSILKREENHNELKQFFSDEEKSFFSISKIVIAGENVSLKCRDNIDDETRKNLDQFIQSCLNEINENKHALFVQKCMDEKLKFFRSTVTKYPDIQFDNKFERHITNNRNCILCFLLASFLSQFSNDQCLSEVCLGVGDNFCTVSENYCGYIPIFAAPLNKSEEPIYGRAVMKKNLILLQSSFESFADNLFIHIAIEGKDVFLLSMLLEELKLMNNVETMIDFIQYCIKENFCSAYFFSSADGYERNSMDDEDEDEIGNADNGNHFNYHSHLLHAVQEGNTADAFHLLQNKHDEELYAQTTDFCSSKLSFHVLASHPTEQRKILNQKPTGFQFLENNFCTFSVPLYTPLYNYIFQTGNEVLLSFFESEGYDGLPSYWVSDSCSEVVEVDGKRFPITEELKSLKRTLCVVDETHKIGDSIFLIGKIGKCVICPFLKEKKLSVGSVSLGICTMIHQSFGMCGVTVFSSNVASHFPPTLAICCRFHNYGVPIKDFLIDPNFTLYYLDKTFNDLDSYEEAVDRLPLPVSSISAVETDRAAFIIKGRLIQILPFERANTVVCLISVTSLNKFKQQIEVQEFM